MKDVSEINVVLGFWNKKLQQRLMDAQQETGQKIKEDAQSLAPVDTGVYKSSIKVSKTILENKTFKTSIYTDLLVGGDDKWAKVPLGALLEWGTGMEGLSSNTYPHGYSYRLTPWTYYYEKIGRYVTTTGVIARPHFYPALVKNKKTYLDNIRKAIKNE